MTLLGFSEAGGTFNASNTNTMAVNNFTQTGGTFVAPASLSVSGNWNYSGGTFTQGTGTVTFNGTGAQALNVSAATETFYNLATSNTSALTIGGSGTLNLSGSLTVGSGTSLTAVGTVTLNGTGQSITGSATFYNLTKTVTTADTLTFASSSTQTISSGGTLTLGGASSQLLSLVSSTPGTQYNITLGANSSSSVSYVNVKDSNASAGYVIPANYSVDSGNNLNWMINSAQITAVKMWKGGTASYLTDWGTITNWQTQSGGTVTAIPASTDGVLIGAATNAPVISNTTGAVTIASLIMSGASTLTMQYSGTNPNLIITGNVIMSGTSNLTHTGGSTTSELYKINMSVAGNFFLASTAQINVTGDGYVVGWYNGGEVLARHTLAITEGVMGG